MTAVIRLTITEDASHPGFDHVWRVDDVSVETKVEPYILEKDGKRFEAFRPTGEITLHLKGVHK